MNKRQRITATNIVRHYLKKLGCHIESVNFVEPHSYEFGGEGNWDMEVNVVENIPCIWKKYKVYSRCENRLLKKYGMNLYLNFY